MAFLSGLTRPALRSAIAALRAKGRGSTRVLADAAGRASVDPLRPQTAALLGTAGSSQAATVPVRSTRGP